MADIGILGEVGRGLGVLGQLLIEQNIRKRDQMYRNKEMKMRERQLQMQEEEMEAALRQREIENTISGFNIANQVPTMAQEAANLIGRPLNLKDFTSNLVGPAMVPYVMQYLPTETVTTEFVPQAGFGAGLGVKEVQPPRVETPRIGEVPPFRSGGDETLQAMYEDRVVKRGMSAEEFRTEQIERKKWGPKSKKLYQWMKNRDKIEEPTGPVGGGMDSTEAVGAKLDKTPVKTEKKEPIMVRPEREEGAGLIIDVIDTQRQGINNQYPLLNNEFIDSVARSYPTTREGYANFWNTLQKAQDDMLSLANASQSNEEDPVKYVQGLINTASNIARRNAGITDFMSDIDNAKLKAYDASFQNQLSTLTGVIVDNPNISDRAKNIALEMIKETNPSAAATNFVLETMDIVDAVGSGKLTKRQALKQLEGIGYKYDSWEEFTVDMKNNTAVYNIYRSTTYQRK